LYYPDGGRVKILNFNESQKYLYSLGNEVEAMKLGLENIGALLAGLDDPHEKYKKVQVAGTNGKGSVCAFLNSICLRAGIKTGLYTSPHLVSITERIKVDGVDIAEDKFARLATRVKDAVEELLSAGQLEYLPTFFEQVTAIALLAFAEAEIELAILETGLGGRLDATTAAKAEIVAITQIAFDHQEYLGDTIEKIAAEKAAVIRPGTKAVLTHQSKPVDRVLAGRCREVGVEPVWASTQIQIKREPEIAPAVWGSITTETAYYGYLEFWDMLGKHQFQNAAVAIAIAELLRDEGFDIQNDAVCIGLGVASHPGRLEYIGRFLLDGAHNAAGARALREYLDEFITRPITIIFGAMKGKDVAEMAKILFPAARRVILTQPANSRAMSPDELLSSVAETCDPDLLSLSGSVEEAVHMATAVADRDEVILATGSLYLVGEVKNILTRDRADGGA
jgi:dihydrofolate synthase/folylpolyglutamate synthase